MGSPGRFAIRYSRWIYPLLFVLGLGRSFSSVELAGDEVRVKMGWAFRARFPGSSVRGAVLGSAGWYGIGVHSNLRFDTFAVNGSARNVIWLTIDPPGPGRFLGFRVKVKKIGLSLEDPSGFAAAIGQPPVR